MHVEIRGTRIIIRKRLLKVDYTLGNDLHGKRLVSLPHRCPYLSSLGIRVNFGPNTSLMSSEDTPLRDIALVR